VVLVAGSAERKVLVTLIWFDEEQFALLSRGKMLHWLVADQDGVSAGNAFGGALASQEDEIPAR
jgi:hypothetical protein